MSEDDTDDLFDDSKDDPVMTAPPSKPVHFGCPLAWVQRVLPLVGSAEQLAIAIWLHRRQAMFGGKGWFTVPAKKLEEDLGLSRFARYRALKHLEQAGGVVVSYNGHKAMQVKLLW